MSFKIIRDVLFACGVFGMAGVFDGCSTEVSPQAKLAGLSRSLEESCAEAPADVLGDVVAVLASVEPLDPAEPQAYGSAACSGVIFEFDNPDEEPLHGAWVQASGLSPAESDLLSESRCPERTLQAAYWGYKEKDKTWTQLSAADETAAYVADQEQSQGYCKLEALMLHEGTYQKLRVIARVTQDAETYPMHAIVW